jgi:Ca2+/Na+ antiporter
MDMSRLNKMDARLMCFLTTLRYPKACKTPLSKFLFAVMFNLSMMLLLTVPYFMVDGRIRWLDYIIISGFLLAIFYHWRLWRRLEKQRDGTAESLE